MKAKITNTGIPLMLVSEDDRRSIFATNELLKDKKEFSVIKLKPGKACGGCKHKNDEEFYILEGEVVVFIGNQRILYKKGFGDKFYTGDTHAFYSEKGATIIEFGITEKQKKKSIKDKKMLKELNEINAS